MNARFFVVPGLAAWLAVACLAGCRGSTNREAAANPDVSASSRAAVPEQVPVGPPPSELVTKLPAEVIRASLPELPVMAAPRPRDDVVAAYEFAALHPEVLKYVPCYCGCERSGHQHNESCFIASRDTDGRVVSWDTHGMG